MAPGEDELVIAAQRFAALMSIAARSGGLTPQSEPRKLLAAVRTLNEATLRLVEADAPEREEIERVTAEYERLYERIFAAMKVSGSLENVV